MEELKNTSLSLFTVKEIAQVFRLTDAAIRRMIRDKELPAIQIGREYRIPRHVVEKILHPLHEGNLKATGFGLWKNKKNPRGEDWVRRYRDADKRTLEELLKDLETP